MGKSPDASRKNPSASANEAAERFEVYLAGPITGCNTEQRNKWRTDLKELVRKRRSDIDFYDPVEWSDDWSPLRETLTLRRVDVVVANMWKESVGTTIGIMQAVDVGKPIVVIDPNYLNSKILNGIVAPNGPVRTIEAAAEMLCQIVSGFRDVTVLKSTGEIEAFDRRKIVASIQTACGAAKVPEVLFAQQISARVLQKLRQVQSGEAIPTARLRDAIFEVLEDMQVNTIYDREVRLGATKVMEAWRKKEKYRRGDAGVEELETELNAVRAERDMYRDMWKRLGACRRSNSAQESREPLVPFGNGKSEVLRLPSSKGYPSVHAAVCAAEARFPDSLAVTAETRKHAARSGSTSAEQAYQMLCVLGECGFEAMLDRAEGREPIPLDSWFEQHAPGFQYARGEGGETKRRKKYAEERTVKFEGQEFECWKHLKYGRRADKLLRVYFCQDPETRRIIVGPVGDHLGTFGHDG